MIVHKIHAEGEGFNPTRTGTINGIQSSFCRHTTLWILPISHRFAPPGILPFSKTEYH